MATSLLTWRFPKIDGFSNPKIQHGQGTSLSRYLEMVKDQHKQIYDALVADAKHEKQPQKWKDADRKNGFPTEGMTQKFLAKLALSDKLDKLFKNVVAELKRNGLTVFSGAGAEEVCEKANAASAVLEFPRISKEHESDALLNGVGTLN